MSLWLKIPDTHQLTTLKNTFLIDYKFLDMQIYLYIFEYVCTAPYVPFSRTYNEERCWGVSFITLPNYPGSQTGGFCGRSCLEHLGAYAVGRCGFCCGSVMLCSLAVTAHNTVKRTERGNLRRLNILEPIPKMPVFISTTVAMNHLLIGWSISA